jgi:H/ACA ribonucleoprotein complex subunit 4
LLVKDPNTIPNRWGKRPSDRTLGELLDSGVIALDKPKGPTSHQVTAWAKDILKVKRIAHGGTLDPNVSGVLPICTGTAVKATDLVLSSDKEYVCLMRLHRDKGEAKVREVIDSFVGPIYQIPPVRSAVKRQLRVRKIDHITVLGIDGRDILFRVGCDAGTYIRTLCIDIGEALGVGANMEELRRTRSGKMQEAEAVTLQDLKDAYVFWQQEGHGEWLRTMLRPMEVLLDPLPKVVVKASAVDAICHGAKLSIPGIHMLDEEIRKNSLVALVTDRGEGIALGKARMSSEQIMASKQGVAVDTDRVFMSPGTYPRMWRFSTDL